MASRRTAKRILKSQETMEGAGVRLKRAFGFRQVPQFDPFLLLDDFHSSNPADYMAGFPWHPHRGIETITYVLNGQVEHADSLGNSGVIGPGDVQWMTAGSGIIHHEMPKGGADPLMWGFQLWANLPASHKMMDPRYREVQSGQIPEVMAEGGVRVKVICGDMNGVKGPVQDIVTDPAYLDVALPAGARFARATKPGHTVFVYLIQGIADFDPAGAERDSALGPDQVVLFGDGDEVVVSAGHEGARFLLVSGRPIGEPVAWWGPMVMNTQAELDTAIAEYQNGTFIRRRGA